MNEAMTAPTAALPAIGQLLIIAWSQLKQHWRTWLTIMILPTAMLTVGNVLIYLNLSGGLRALGVTCAVIGDLGVAFGGLAIVSSLIFSQSATQAWDYALSKWLPFLGLLLLDFLFKLGGFLLFIIPALLYAVWFSLAIFCFIKEDQRGLNALWRSRELFRGVFWRLVGRYLIALLIIIVVNIIAAAVLGRNTWGQAIINILLMPVVTGFIYAYLLNIYVARAAAVPMASGRPVSLKVLIAPIIGLVVGGILTLLVLGAVQYQQVLQRVGANLPQDSAAAGRDLERQLVAETVLRPVLHNYYVQNKKYPASLSLPDLQEWLQDMPTDPQGGAYDYQLLQNGQSYKICPRFEQRVAICFGPTAASSSTQ